MIESAEKDRPLESPLDAWHRGFSVIQLEQSNRAIPNSGKKPVGKWKESQWLRCTEAEAAAMTGNYGIVTGAVSGVIGLDVDSPEAMNWVRENIVLPDSFTKTPRGWHLIFRHPGVTVKNGVKLKGLPLDVRGDGGYIVGPGSIHWTGEVYEAVGPWGIESLPVFNMSWLERERRPWRGRNIEVSPMEDRARVVRRALGAALSPKTPDAVAGEGGHNRFYSVACLLTHEPPNGFGLNEQEALPILMAYNTSKCKPPFNDREVVHKLTEALKVRFHRTIGGDQ